MKFSEIETIEQYLQQYGSIIAKQSQAALRPLHVPSRDDVPSFDLLRRKPYGPQAHVIAATIKQLNRDRCAFIIGEQGCGKAQPLDAKILTPTGWATMGEMKVGKKIVDPDGGVAKIVGVFKRGVRDVFEVEFSDGSKTKCCSEHLWAVNTHIRISRGNEPVIRQTSEIAGSIKMNWGAYRHWVKNVTPVEFVDTLHHSDIDPYIMGALLGDGGLTSGQKNNSIVLTSDDPELVNEIRWLIRGDVELRPTGQPCSYRISGSRGSGPNPVLDCLRRHSLMGKRSFEKHIPLPYLFSSVENRLSLLQGLMDTDGSCHAGVAVDYVTTSRQLAEDVRQLVLSLGGTTEIKEKETTYEYLGEKLQGRLAYRLYIKLPECFNPFRLSRKSNAYHRVNRRPQHRAIVSVTKVGREECWCIAVDSSRNLYVTDDYIVTHNTLMAIAAAAEKFKNRPYRVIIMCPPHLTHKWEREIRKTISGSLVIHLRSVTQLMALDRGEKPTCAEWWIVKENAAKSGAAWQVAINDHPHGFARCPDCGELIADSKGMPVSTEDLRASAKLMFHEYSCPTNKKGQIVECSGEPPIAACRRQGDKVARFGSTLFSYCRTDSSRQDRMGNEGDALWAIAKYARTHLKRFFDMFICDETHENRSPTSARATAMGQIAAASKCAVGLTGTFAGGYAWQLRTLLFRLSPNTLVNEGFAWEDEAAFNRTYGRLETKIISTSGVGETRGQRQNTRSQGQSRRQTTSVKPGIMPTLFGRHLLDKCIFLSLDELADNLPALEEKVIPVEMDEELAREYQRIEKKLRDALKEMLRKGDKRLLSALLHTLLSYPDHPYGFGEIGYQDKVPDGEGGYELVDVPVVKPKNLSLDTLRNKEDALLKFIKKEVKAGRQCWVYVQDTNKYDIQPRLQSLLQEEGMRVKILRSNTVPTEDREDWIEEHARGCDVIISHPQLVQTGLDLFSPNGSHNFSTLIFYQTGYELYVLRQAARRAWRIGQTENCKVVYFYYANTMAQTAMNLMGKKLVASEAIEGKFTAEGLAAMADDGDSMEVALAKSLVNRMDDSDTERNWNRISMSRGGSAKLVKKAEAVVEADLLGINRPLKTAGLFQKSTGKPSKKTRAV